ncbi:MAG: 30S ribosomal protein S17 [Planctomycetota bacterium]|jgi:small subunit ribosomal protein S17
MSENIRAKGRLESGIVVTAGNARKTITVESTRRFKHPRYQKYMKRRKRFLVHDEHETANSGDLVRIIETRPYSKRKRWRLLEVLERSKMDFERVPGEMDAEMSAKEKQDEPQKDAAPEGNES